MSSRVSKNNILLVEAAADVFEKRCSEKICNIHRKTFMLKPLFNQVAVPLLKIDSNTGVFL